MSGAAFECNYCGRSGGTWEHACPVTTLAKVRALAGKRWESALALQVAILHTLGLKDDAACNDTCAQGCAAKTRVVKSDGITITALSVSPEVRAGLNTGGARLPPLDQDGEP